MNLSELVDIGELRGLCESFTAITGAVTAVLDLEGKVLIATGWQDICTQFHRVHPDTCARCLESDTILAGHLSKGESYNVYRCKNGLVDVAVPIIIADEHVANLFTGQFFFEPPDKRFFVRQAKVFGFDESAYLGAMARAPVFSEKQVRLMMAFFTRLAKVMGEMGLARLRLQQANTKLQQSFEIIQSSEDAIIGKSLDGIIQSWNPGAEKLFGYPSSEAIGSPMTMLIPPDRADEEADIVSRIARGESVHHFETLRRRKDGQLIHVSAAISPIRDGAGQVVGASKIARDITQRKQVEEALRISEQRHRLITEHARDVIWTMSPEGKITFVSPSVEVVRGFTPAEAMQQTVAEIYTPDSQAVSLGYFTQLHADIQAGRAPQSFRGELEYRCKNGSTLWTEVITTPILNDQGVVVELLGMTRDISERKRAEELVRQLAYYDPLTQLANRMLLKDRLTQSMLAGERSGHYGALMFLDMDNFKPLNDLHGHEAGDHLLVEVARRLKSCVRQMDTVGRFGGDEFVVLLHELTSDINQAHDQADLVAGKIRKLLAQPYFLKIVSADADVRQAVEHRCTASIGVALFRAQENRVDEVIKWADLAMYNAKEAGRNRVCFCDVQMWTDNRSSQMLEKDLFDAVLNHEFCVYIQAQFNRQNQITGADAVLRWQHPSRGWVSPREFIPKAEKTGLILPLGLWVLESACAQLALWAKRAELVDLTLTVKVSGRQLVQRDFVEQVKATLARTGANPHQLKIEIKESVILADVEGVIAKVNALKAMGIGISLQDFGKSYSSLSDLNRLRLDQLKIAQHFVSDITSDPGNATLTKMLLALASTLEVDVVAEGVETEAQRDFLASLGCHKYQGGLFSPALPVQEFEALVARVRSGVQATG